MEDLGEGTVVPDVSVVREAVVHKAELALLDVLLDGVERGGLVDLDWKRKKEKKIKLQSNWNHF